MQILDILLARGAQVSRREVFAPISVTTWLPCCRGHGAELPRERMDGELSWEHCRGTLEPTKLC